ncbi:MAG: dipicolinate synthase subunit B [Ruminococcaceae bacterium]|nr:dipicolinate synthase subunit B [Oscillospiraceae bacterium]
MIGYAICGSFCTHAKALGTMRRLASDGYDILPIVSETVFSTDTRFGKADDLLWEIKDICKKDIIHTVKDAEPLGPSIDLDALLIAPCTGNTLAKMARGITDGAVTMAAKAHLRCDRPMLIALASNDAMSANLASIAAMLQRKNVYFVPMKQDDPAKKPHSLIADFEKIPEAMEAMKMGKQMRPLFL